MSAWRREQQQHRMYAAAAHAAGCGGARVRQSAPPAPTLHPLGLHLRACACLSDVRLRGSAAVSLVLPHAHAGGWRSPARSSSKSLGGASWHDKHAPILQ